MIIRLNTPLTHTSELRNLIRIQYPHVTVGSNHELIVDSMEDYLDLIDVLITHTILEHSPRKRRDILEEARAILLINVVSVRHCLEHLLINLGDNPMPSAMTRVIRIGLRTDSSFEDLLSKIELIGYDTSKLDPHKDSYIRETTLWNKYL